MMTLRLLLPFSYLFETRFRRTPMVMAFHAYYEWIPNILLLVWSAGIVPLDALPAKALTSLGMFLGGYLGFVAVYEIGYLVNDLVSVRHEENPRRRLGDFAPRPWQLALWVGFRILWFLGASMVLGSRSPRTWIVFYLVLAVAFALHNTLKNYGFRLPTFVTLALLRFFGPIFVFVPHAALAGLLFPVLLCYVLYRAVNYLYAKGLLRLDSKYENRFPIGFYALLLGPSILAAEFSETMLPVWLNLYYLAGWSLFAVLGLKRSAESSGAG